MKIRSLVYSNRVNNKPYQCAAHSAPTFGSFFATKIRNMPCACCNIKTITSADFRHRINPAALEKSATIALKELKPFESNMHKIERRVFNKLQRDSKLSPESTLQELLIKMKEESLNKLRASQFAVLDHIDRVSESLSRESKAKVLELTKKNREIISIDNPNLPFKRKKFISLTKELVEGLPEAELGTKIYNLSLKLNNSENDINAFVVKYARRSSKEIGQRLLCKSIATEEHIKPKAKGGENKLFNYIVECAGCNNKRGDTELSEWIGQHNKMPQFTQKQVDLIINLLNRGKYKRYKAYPTLVEKRLAEESKGLIKIDTSSIKYETHM